MHGSLGDIRRHPRRLGDRVRFAGLLTLGLAFYIVCLNVAEVSFAKLWAGLPRLGSWAARAWPPDFSEVGILSVRAAETVAMGTIGTSFGALLAVPVCLLAARNVTHSAWLSVPARGLLNTLRGIDSFIFALIFVAAVGLGPFAGVLGLSLHAAGSIAKLWSESIETVEPGPIEAVTMSGAGRLKVIRYALIPDVLPSLSSITLYMWEWSIRASTVLGVVGAGGIGQELKNSVDLLQFDRVLTILLLILAMVTAIDTVSAWLRRSSAVRPILAARGLTKAFGARIAVNDVSLSVRPGEFVAVLGASGSGKTSLFRCLTRLIAPDAGEIDVAGESFQALRGRKLAAARRQIGVVFQQFNLVHRLSALDNVLAGRLAAAPLWRVMLRQFNEADEAIAIRALRDVGLGDHLDQRADTLSGGQQQRVAIARALAQESRIILADEPVASLDPETAVAILELLQRLTRTSGLAVICTLHQPQLAERFADRILRMDGGRLSESPRQETATERMPA